jgi:heat-inducible transcriptional repressor
MQVQSLAQDEMIRIRKAMDERIEEINRLFRKASIIISNITGYTSVVVSPQLSRTRIKSIQLIKIDEKSILVVVVAGGGIVKNKLISHNQIVEDVHLAKLNQAANLFLADKSIGQLTMPVAVDLQREINMPAEVILAILESVDECIRKIETTDIYLEGITNILNYPEFSDLIKAREILDLLNEEEIITGLVRSVTKNKQFDFKIGSENQIDEMKDLSIITTVYGREGKDVGTIGVIGPTRMAYSKVVSSIKYIRELLNKEIIRLFGDDP